MRNWSITYQAFDNKLCIILNVGPPLVVTLQQCLPEIIFIVNLLFIYKGKDRPLYIRLLLGRASTNSLKSINMDRYVSWAGIVKTRYNPKVKLLLAKSKDGWKSVDKQTRHWRAYWKSKTAMKNFYLCNFSVDTESQVISSFKILHFTVMSWNDTQWQT